MPDSFAGFAVQGGAPLVAARAIFVCALLSLHGTAVFWALIVPKLLPPGTAAAAAVRSALFRLGWGSLALAVLAAGIWSFIEAGLIAGVDGAAQTFAILPVVLEHTEFGNLALGQTGLLVATGGILLAARSFPRTAMIGAVLATGANLALQAAHGHATAMYGWFSLLFLVDVLHLLAAAGWAGGLLPLVLVVRLVPPRQGAIAARWFSPWGKCCVSVLAGSALAQGWVMVGSLTALAHSPYGAFVIIKTALFVLLLGFALLNRYRLAPALQGGQPESARRRLVSSILLQTAVGIAAVWAAAVLSGLAPTMKM